MYPNIPNRKNHYYDNNQGGQKIGSEHLELLPSAPPPPYPQQQGQVPGYPPPSYTQVTQGHQGLSSHREFPFPPAGPAYPSLRYQEQHQLTFNALPQPEAYLTAEQAGHSTIQAPYSTYLEQSSYPALNSPGEGAQAHQYQEKPTLHEYWPFDPTADAQVLRKSVKSLLPDKKAIINVLGKRTDNQRQQIAQAFHTAFGKDLLKSLKSELEDYFKQVVKTLLTPRYDFLAYMLDAAMSRLFTIKEKALIDIICASTNNEIRMITASYQRLLGRPLELDLKSVTSEDFYHFLVLLTSAERSEDPLVNPVMAFHDVQKLIQAGENNLDTDESVFTQILATRSYAQLRLTVQEYERLAGHPFEKAITSNFSGDLKKAMLAVVKIANNRASYFAERVHYSVTGLVPKNNDLILIIVTRAEIDLESIKTEYIKMYGRSMAKDVATITSGIFSTGSYCKMLLTLLGM